MSNIKNKLKEQIKNLSKKELEDIVIKLVHKKENYDYIYLNYLDKQDGEQFLYENAIADIDNLSKKRFKGFSWQLQYANYLIDCSKRINEFSQVSKNNKLVADLLLYVLKFPFSCSTNLFGTCFTKYDTQVGLLLRKLINLVTKKLHEDYRIEYVEKINQYLSILHRTSSHIDIINNLPKSIH